MQKVCKIVFQIRFNGISKSNEKRKRKKGNKKKVSVLIGNLLAVVFYGIQTISCSNAKQQQQQATGTGIQNKKGR